ncbi:MAG: GNAT family N-acetyltransferase [Rubrivivax sp.]|nr:GNAT family N-acetyltransferase [Rubrivivax sp.]
MLRRVLGPFKEFGLVAGVLYLIDRMLRSVSPRLGLFVYELMVQPIASKPMLPANLTKNLRFAEIGRGDPELALMPAREDIKAARFDQGARCLGTYRKDKLIGYIWFSFGHHEEDEVRCDYELTAREQSVFDFDLYVLPEHRMGIAFMAIWHGANEYLHQRGIRYTFSRLTRFNLASRRSHAHLGWRRVGQAVFLQAWAVELMLADIHPYVALTWSPTQRTRLRLAPDALLATAPAPGQAARPPTRSAGEQPEPKAGP